MAAKNTDTREHDIADSDDYFQYHGGMVATVRALTGKDPAAYIGDNTRPDAVRTRTLSEETTRVFRARVVNPRWMNAMRRHGYKGAFEMAATVDYLFGYDATAGVMADWMYERLDREYVLDDGEPQVHGRVQPVGAARHGRAAAGSRRSRHVGAARGSHPRRSAPGAAGDRGRPRGMRPAERERSDSGDDASSTFMANIRRRRRQYILLTTFTKDGRPKPTAIWAAADGDRLIASPRSSPGRSSASATPRG